MKLEREELIRNFFGRGFWAEAGAIACYWRPGGKVDAVMATIEREIEWRERELPGAVRELATAQARSEQRLDVIEETGITELEVVEYDLNVKIACLKGELKHLKTTLELLRDCAERLCRPEYEEELKRIESLFA